MFSYIKMDDTKVFKNILKAEDKTQRVLFDDKVLFNSHIQGDKD